MRKGELLEAILEQKEAGHKDGWNIATSQHRDVGSINLKVNKWQRRDVSTSRRQREFCLLTIKSKMGCGF